MMGVYLLHFDSPISEDHTTQHYIGWAEDIDHRLEEHKKGNGARLTQVALERGIGWQLVKVWEHACRDTERKIKKRKNAPRQCPICIKNKKEE